MNIRNKANDKQFNKLPNIRTHTNIQYSIYEKRFSMITKEKKKKEKKTCNIAFQHAK